MVISFPISVLAIIHAEMSDLSVNCKQDKLEAEM